MSAEVMKFEVECETCCVCGGGGELLTPEEHDAGAHGQVQVPLRTMLLQLNCNKTMPDGRLCANCIRRAMEAYEFSTALSTKGTPPLSEKIRALRRRLHELTQKIDVFIVVGGAGGGGAGSYSEDDIIMVERDALAAAAAADDEDLERARNARGDSVYQCSVCPLSFQRVSEYRMHLGTHPADAQHSCWTCGAQFARRGALASHAAAHCGAALACHLCGAAAGGAAELRRHEAACPPRCPACAQLFADRAALSAHAHAAHGRAARAARAAGPCVCPTCFRVCDTPELLTAHLLRHRQAKHYVCGYDACILRFATRNNLVAHIRKCHAGSPPAHEPAPAAAGAAAAAAAAGAGAAAAAGAAPHVACDTCGRTFGSMAAMKRHARVHRRANDQHDQMEGGGGGGGEWQEGEAEDMEGEVEYLEVDELDDRFEEKPNIDAML